MLVSKQSNGAEVRTYSRNRNQVRVNHNWRELCRLCLNKTNHMTPIFSEEANKLCVSLASKIILCLGLEVTEEDEFPKHICELCYTHLERFYYFKTKCVAIFQKLKNNILKAKSDKPHRTYMSKRKKANEERDVQQEKSQDSQPQSVKIRKSLINSNQILFSQLENQSLETEDTNSDAAGVATTNLESDPVHQNLIFKVANQNLKVEVANQRLSLEILNQNLKVENCIPKTETQAEIDHQRFVLETENQNATLEAENHVQTSDHNLKSEVILEETVVNDVSMQGMDYVVESEQGINIEQDIIGMNVEMEEEASVDPKETIASYLVAELVDRGVLAKRGDCLEVVNREAMTFNLLTPYGSPVIMQLVEEDEVTSVTHEEPKVTKQKHNKNSCEQCGGQFSSRGALVRHARVHSGERPFACAVCGLAFKQREVLRRHQLLHAEKLPFQCGECPKAYTQAATLRAHRRRHAPAPPPLHRCAHCPKAFLYPSGLSRHLRMHEGLVFTCVTCNRSFRDKSSLLRHARFCPRPKPAGVTS